MSKEDSRELYCRSRHSGRYSSKIELQDRHIIGDLECITVQVAKAKLQIRRVNLDVPLGPQSFRNTEA